LEKHSAFLCGALHLGDGVTLHKILPSVIHCFDLAEERLRNRLLVLEFRPELELVRNSALARSDVVAGCDIDFVENIVVETVVVRSDPRLFNG
jgi:hypothetical protein